MNAKAENTAPTERAESEPTENNHEFQEFRKDWWVFLILGITLMVCGIAAMTYPFVSSVSVIMIIGAVLIVGGVSLIVSSFWAGKWSGLFLQMLVGIFYTIAGFTIFDAPLRSLVIFTLLLAAFFIVIGLLRIVTALVDRYPMWGWSLLNGLVTLIVGLVIYRHCRPSAIMESLSEGVTAEALAGSYLWIIGLLVGIDLIFNGINWLMLSLAIRRLPEEEATEPG